jgi:cyclohexyl-isocyanide hydratase
MLEFKQPSPNFVPPEGGRLIWKSMKRVAGVEASEPPGFSEFAGGSPTSEALVPATPVTQKSSLGDVPPEQHLQIGALVFPQVDQMDLTGPFAVLSRLPNSSFQLLWKNTQPVRDMHGLTLTPDATFADAQPIDLLLVPGGAGQEALMEDDFVLSFIAHAAAQAKCVFSVCTGALVLGAARLLMGRAATCYWPAFELLKYFGAVPTSRRGVVDGNFVTAAGLTAGIDGALQVAAMLRGQNAAEAIQLALQYDPQPPFDCGSPEKAPAELIADFKRATADLMARRLATAKRVAAKLGTIQRDDIS